VGRAVGSSSNDSKTVSVGESVGLTVGACVASGERVGFSVGAWVASGDRVGFDVVGWERFRQ
jgi:hypothetical protein